MTDPSPTVLVPVGAPLLDAAAWVGASCRAELELHARLTAALADGVGPDRSSALWTVRAHRAELAEAWHRRLPELREFPREGFVAAPATGSSPDEAPATTDSSADDLGWVTAALRALLDRYAERVPVAVGSADGPTADTLQQAIRRTQDDLAAVVAVVAAIG
jgi:hypothetical protein